MAYKSQCYVASLCLPNVAEFKLVDCVFSLSSGFFSVDLDWFDDPNDSAPDYCQYATTPMDWFVAVAVPGLAFVGVSSHQCDFCKSVSCLLMVYFAGVDDCAVCTEFSTG